MKYVYRNTAIEYLFPKDDYIFSDYGNLYLVDDNQIDTFIYFNFLPFEYDIELLLKWIDYYQSAIINNLEKNKNKQNFVLKLKNYHYKSFELHNHLLENRINDFNSAINKLNGVNVIDLDDFSSESILDFKYYYTYNAIINPLLKKEFQNWFEKQLQLFSRVPKKCLVLDLDNTLWGGILAEDGFKNIKLGGAYPGNAYLDFQKLILNLKQMGVILCIASKNNEKDVEECFSKRNDLILKLSDFAIKKISWQSKDKSITEISKELNISFDSIVFIDDSPQERELIKSMCLGVEVLDFPEHPYLLAFFYSKEFIRLFAKNKITQEDLVKTELYEKKIKADNEKKLFKTEDEYIADLNINVNFQELSDSNINRIVELINKTNQFNTTTKRYNYEQIYEMKKECFISAISVRDKFGDLGIVGCAIIKFENNLAILDSFMLSCRVLGRKIENMYLDILKTKLKEKNINELIGIVIPTAKNTPVRDCYLKCGFTEMEKTEFEVKYKLKL